MNDRDQVLKSLQMLSGYFKTQESDLISSLSTVESNLEHLLRVAENSHLVLEMYSEELNEEGQEFIEELGNYLEGLNKSLLLVSNVVALMDPGSPTVWDIESLLNNERNVQVTIFLTTKVDDDQLLDSIREVLEYQNDEIVEITDIDIIEI